MEQEFSEVRISPVQHQGPQTGAQRRPWWRMIIGGWQEEATQEGGAQEVDRTGYLGKRPRPSRIGGQQASQRYAGTRGRVIEQAMDPEGDYTVEMEDGTHQR